MHPDAAPMELPSAPAGAAPSAPAELPVPAEAEAEVGCAPGLKLWTALAERAAAQGACDEWLRQRSPRRRRLESACLAVEAALARACASSAFVRYRGSGACACSALARRACATGRGVAPEASDCWGGEGQSRAGER